MNSKSQDTSRPDATIQNENREPAGSYQGDAAASGLSNNIPILLADNIQCRAAMIAPLFGLMFQQLEDVSYNREEDPCGANAIEALYSLADSARRYLDDIKKLCDDARAAARKAGA